MTKFIEIHPATERGNSEPRILLNLDFVSCIRPSKDKEIGTCTFIIEATPETFSIETWTDYKTVMEELLG